VRAASRRRAAQAGVGRGAAQGPGRHGAQVERWRARATAGVAEGPGEEPEQSDIGRVAGVSDWGWGEAVISKLMLAMRPPAMTTPVMGRTKRRHAAAELAQRQCHRTDSRLAAQRGRHPVLQTGHEGESSQKS
jgi:hypothetical protein